MAEKTKIFDPVRRKWIVLNPEEEVRQFVVRFLRENCGVPLGYIACESPIHLYGHDFRCDISVSNRKLEAVMIVECKRPSVALTEAVLEQAMRYNLLRHERFVVITNGRDFRCFERLEAAGNPAAASSGEVAGDLPASSGATADGALPASSGATADGALPASSGATADGALPASESAALSGETAEAADTPHPLWREWARYPLWAELNR